MIDRIYDLIEPIVGIIDNYDDKGYFIYLILILAFIAFVCIISLLR